MNLGEQIQIANLAFTIFAFMVAQTIAMIIAFVRLESRLKTIEERLGDKDSGITSHVHDLETRMRTVERVKP